MGPQGLGDNGRTSDSSGCISGNGGNSDEENVIRGETHTDENDRVGAPTAFENGRQRCRRP
jgi:hypothetical protein